MPCHGLQELPRSSLARWAKGLHKAVAGDIRFPMVAEGTERILASATTVSFLPMLDA